MPIPELKSIDDLLYYKKDGKWIYLEVADDPEYELKRSKLYELVDDVRLNIKELREEYKGDVSRIIYDYCTSLSVSGLGKGLTTESFCKLLFEYDDWESFGVNDLVFEKESE